MELAGQIRELACRSLTRDFPHIESALGPGHGGRRRQGAAGGLGGQLSGRARAELEKMGVEFQMGLQVVGVDPFGVDTERADDQKSRIECGTVILAAGVQASALAGKLASVTGAGPTGSVG